MTRTALLSLLLLLLTGTALLLELNACGAPSVAAFSGAGKLQHIVLIVQENRTPDNLFHDPVLIARGADIANSGIASAGATIALEPTPLGVGYDLSHKHSAFLAMYASGKMNGADKIPVSCSVGHCPPPRNPQFKYVQASDGQPYFAIAEQYTFGDRMFQTNQGPSFPAHQFLISGTSAPAQGSDLFAAENPNTVFLGGCTQPADSTVALIDPHGNETSTMFPCFEHVTLTDELDSRNIEWRYYAASASYIWTAPNAIRHICQPASTNGNLECTGNAWKKVIIPSKKFLTDIAKNELAAVTWITPAGQYSDHPNSVHGNGGPSWVAAVVNAIGNSAFWENTAIIVTWDDWGGWYDHVPPPKIINDGRSWGSGYVYGFRVPLIVISPYAKPEYVSHVNHDFGSILNFIEQVFRLHSLGYADAHTHDDDLSDCFNFSQSPRQFKTIDAPLKADHFINDTEVPEDPDSD